MKVVAYPADEHGCGHHRIIWPGESLRASGHDVTVVQAKDRNVQISLDRDGHVVGVDVPDGIDVIVFQRSTDRRLVEAIQWLTSKGYAVVIDVDDDLSAIHPANPAWTFLDPNRAMREAGLMRREGLIRPDSYDEVTAGLQRRYTHSWRNLSDACRYATMVTVSTPGLLRRYAAHGRGRVVPNYVPDHYLDIEHVDSDVIGWPAALPSHPNDPAAVGNAVARVVSEGASFRTVGNPAKVGRAFGLSADPPGCDVEIGEWPNALAEIGIGIAPLADTRFNLSKSFLKPVEMSAVGVPWVASPRAEYVRLHEMGAGVLAEKPRDWYRSLRMLIDSPERRAEMSESGRAVARSLRLSDHSWRHWAAWEDALALARSGKVSVS